MPICATAVGPRKVTAARRLGSVPPLDSRLTLRASTASTTEPMAIQITMGSAHDSTMPWPPSPITARAISRPSRTTANSALRHTAHHGLPMATRIVSWTTNTVHPAADATNSTTPTQNGQSPGGRVPDVGQQEHVDQRDRPHRAA